MPPKLTKDLLIEAMYRYKINFAKAAGVAGGTVRWAGQHSLLWGAMNKGGQGAFDEDFWVGVCAGLSLEWMKQRRRDGDMIRRFLDVRKEALTKEGAKPNVESFSGLINIAHAKQNQVAGFLKNEFRKVGDNSFRYPYSNFGASLTPGLFYYISSGTHAMAGCMPRKGSVDFYDPNVGEIKGTSPKFFNSYFKDVVDSSALAKKETPGAGRANGTIGYVSYESVG